MQATARYGRVQWRALSLLTVFTMLLGVISLAGPGIARADTDLVIGGEARVSFTDGDNIRLRAQPSTSGTVLTSVPEGWLVAVLDGPFSDGAGSSWYQVIARGQTGYMVSDYLANPGSSGNSGSATVIDTAVVFDGRLNMRSGPGTSNSVLLVLPDAAEVGILGSSQNGFYPVRYNGVDGWATADYLDFGGSASPSDAGLTLYADGTLNLRSGPGTGFGVLLVIPGGGAVETTGSSENGFWPVVYSGTAGYASADFLLESPPASAPVPSAPATGGSRITWPVSGGAWEITQGYNGSSHVNRSSTWQYYYSFDLAREDRSTAGQSVYAPASGTVRWTQRSSGGIVIDMGNGYAVALFHVTVDRGWTDGAKINQGDFIGTVSYPGGEGYAEFPHVHFTVWASTDGGNWSREAVPFSGQNAINGVNYGDTGGGQQWTGTIFYP